MGFVLFAFAVASVTARAHILKSTPGQIVDSRFDSEQGYRDFHNAVYFPVRAFLSGVNPYSQDFVKYHPDEISFPLFSPTMLLLHAPLGFLQLHVAEIVWMSFNVCLLLWISLLIFKFSKIPATWGGVFLIAGLIIMCRPGLLNFFGVQVTLMHMLGCLIALEYGRSHPVFAGFGVLLAFSKPTFAIPLAIMLLCRRNVSAFAAGTAMCAATSFLVIGIIGSQNGGLKEFSEQVIAQYGSFDAHPEIPEVVTSWTRIDFYSVLVRWFELPAEINWKILVPVAVICFGAFCMLLEQNRNQRDGAVSRSGVFALLIIIASFITNRTTH